jgi:nucleoside-diphosphate-sugar epimerase
MKIVVTGAAGFIGSHCCERLAHAGHAVVGIDCLTPYYPVALKEANAAAVEAAGIAFHRLDLARDALDDALEGAEMVFHLAAQPGISAHMPLETYVRNNITATDRLLNAAERAGSVRGFVSVSTSSVYGAHATDDEEAAPKPTSYYGVTKLAAEQLVLARHRAGRLAACSLRIFSVYGPRERPDKLYPKLIRAILEDAAFPLYEGSERHERSYTYVGDILDGFEAALERFDACAGEIVNLGSDRCITTGEGIALVEKIMGKTARKVSRPRRPGDQIKTHADIAKARRLLDYDPHTQPEVGLRAEVDWYRDEVFGKIAI